MRFTLPFAMGLALFTATAQANTLVVAPVLSGNVDDKMAGNIHQLIASELDFADGVDDVVDLEERPAALNTSCLKSTSCLRGITSGQGDQLITGVLQDAGPQIVIDLLLYDLASNRIVRRKAFSLDRSSESIAVGMTGVVQETLTGIGKAEKEAAAVSASDFADDEDDDFDFNAGAAEAAAAAAALEAQRRAEEEARRQAAEAAARQRAEEEARRRAEEEARRRAEEEARRRAEEEARRRAEEEATSLAAAQPVETDEVDLDSISFGSGEIKTEEITVADINFGSSSSSPSPDYSASPSYEASSDFGDFIDEEEEELLLEEEEDRQIVDLDAPPPKQKPTREKQQRTSKPSPRVTEESRTDATVTRDGPKLGQVSVRAGMSQYYSFRFVTGGVELGFRVYKGLILFGGVEAYSVKQQTTEGSQWQQMYPLTVGAMYKFTGKVPQPFVGIEGISVMYFQNETGSEWAAGARVRGGCDFMLSERFGLTVNVAVGGWFGPAWNLIDANLQNSGLVPQGNAGVLLSF